MKKFTAANIGFLSIFGCLRIQICIIPHWANVGSYKGTGIGVVIFGPTINCVVSNRGSSQNGISWYQITPKARMVTGSSCKGIIM